MVRQCSADEEGACDPAPPPPGVTLRDLESRAGVTHLYAVQMYPWYRILCTRCGVTRKITTARGMIFVAGSFRSKGNTPQTSKMTALEGWLRDVCFRRRMHRSACLFELSVAVSEKIGFERPVGGVCFIACCTGIIHMVYQVYFMAAILRRGRHAHPVTVFFCVCVYRFLVLPCTLAPTLPREGW